MLQRYKKNMENPKSSMLIYVNYVHKKMGYTVTLHCSSENSNLKIIINHANNSKGIYARTGEV